MSKEIDRLERMPPHSAEVVVLRNYIDWILALPWQERTEDRLDMLDAQQVLDEDHYGLEKVKERIVEFLAVRQLRTQQVQRQARAAAQRRRRNWRRPDQNASHKGPILCLDRAARRRQDLAGPLGRARAWPQVRAHLARRRA